MKKLISIIAIALASTIAHAQALKVSTGSATGTYSRMTKEIQGVCNKDVLTVEVNSSGSNENIDRMLGNEVQLIWTQTDALFWRSRTEDLSDVKTLVAFHPEQVHVVATAATFKVGGTMGFGGSQVSLNTISDLAGRRVVAAGGSYTTANIIRLQSEIGYKLDEVANDAAALEELKSGKAAAAIFVGGAPLKTLDVLDRNFKLLSIPDDVATKLKNVYKSDAKAGVLNYNKLGSTGVKTVYTEAILATRKYSSSKMTSDLSKLRKCILANINSREFAETTGTHPAWQKVDGSNQGKWPWYEIK